MSTFIMFVGEQFLGHRIFIGIFEHILSSHTANVLDAETATISCVTFPVALQMHYVQLLAAANFWYNFCNFELQILQLYRLFILKIFAAIFAPFRCILEEEIVINLMGFEPMTFHTKPSRFIDCAIWNDGKMYDK